MYQKCIGSGNHMAKFDLVWNLDEIRASPPLNRGKRDKTLETADQNFIENLDLVAGCATVTLEVARLSRLGQARVEGFTWSAPGTALGYTHGGQAVEAIMTCRRFQRLG